MGKFPSQCKQLPDGLPILSTIKPTSLFGYLLLCTTNCCTASMYTDQLAHSVAFEADTYFFDYDSYEICVSAILAKPPLLWQLQSTHPLTRFYLKVHLFVQPNSIVSTDGFPFLFRSLTPRHMRLRTAYHVVPELKP